jgi:predicted 3-demethylubiquinone-9 3-methyltransferase (glyoxalase superfamily)
MPVAAQKILPCLWFDTEAEEAAKFYCSIFKDSRIETISRYGNEGHEKHGREPGSVMVVVFDLEGQRFVGLNGGPHFKFTEARSRSTARASKRWTTIGASSPRAAKRFSAAG